MNEIKLLDKANSYFVSQDYTNALFLYSQLSSEFPNNEEYPMYALFCDIGFEDTEKAQSLFDYFSVAKDEDLNHAITYSQDIINAYDGDIDKMTELLNDVSTQAHENLEAINYEDFNNLVKSRGSFKTAYQDIMFSTKVAITSKEQFFDFVDQLINNDFVATAYKYLDGFNEYFTYDAQLEDLYKRLESKKLDNLK